MVEVNLKIQEFLSLKLLQVIFELRVMYFFLTIHTPWAVERTHWLRIIAFLPDDQSLVPSMHVGWFTTAYKVMPSYGFTGHFHAFYLDIQT